MDIVDDYIDSENLESLKKIGFDSDKTTTSIVVKFLYEKFNVWIGIKKIFNPNEFGYTIQTDKTFKVSKEYYKNSETAINAGIKEFLINNFPNC